MDLQLLSQCDRTYNCLSRSVPETHSHVAGTLSNQPTNKLFLYISVSASLLASLPLSPSLPVHPSLHLAPLSSGSDAGSRSLCEQLQHNKWRLSLCVEWLPDPGRANMVCSGLTSVQLPAANNAFLQYKVNFMRHFWSVISLVFFSTSSLSVCLSISVLVFSVCLSLSFCLSVYLSQSFSIFHSLSLSSPPPPPPPPLTSPLLLLAPPPSSLFRKVMLAHEASAES